MVFQRPLIANDRDTHHHQEESISQSEFPFPFCIRQDDPSLARHDEWTANHCEIIFRGGVQVP